MGWLEVLAMLKRLVPLLTRVAPMLETFVAARVAGREDSAALERIATELKSDIISTTATHRTETQAALAEQAAELRDLRTELKHLREEHAAGLSEANRRIETMHSGLRTLAVTIIGLIVLCMVLLTLLLLRR